MGPKKLRWQYRFDNFKRAYFLLQEASEQFHKGTLDQLGKEGMIQRFEYCMELAWKTIKDYLESQGVIFHQITPHAVIKEAVSTKFIDDGESWMKALDDRNKMSRTYDFTKFENVIEQINERYIESFGKLYENLSRQYESIK